MKKLIYIVLVVCIVLIIYTIKKDNKIQFLVLGNNIDPSIEKEVKELLKKNQRYENSLYSEANYIIEILNDIDSNKKINSKVTINNALVKSELIVLNIDYSDMININQNELKTNLDRLIKKLRKITKENIVLLSPSSKDLQDTYYEVSKLNHIEYIDSEYKLLKYIENDIMK